MLWEIVLGVGGLIGLLFLPKLSRQFRGTRCPNCNCRLRRTGLTHIIPKGEFPTWLCPSCGSRFYGSQEEIQKSVTSVKVP